MTSNRNLYLLNSFSEPAEVGRLVSRIFFLQLFAKLNQPNYVQRDLDEFYCSSRTDFRVEEPPNITATVCTANHKYAQR